MKTQLLSLVATGIALLSHAQVPDFELSNDKTGFVTNGQNQDNTSWKWNLYNATCAGGDGGASGGGYDFSTNLYFSHGYGFGGESKYLILIAAQDPAYYLDLSSSNNQKLEFSASLTETDGGDPAVDVSNAAFSRTITVELYDENYGIVASKEITMTNTSEIFDVDFSDVVGTNDLTQIRQIAFSDYNCGVNAQNKTYRLYGSILRVGTYHTTGLADAASVISSTSLYPNPSSEKLNVEMMLKKASQVKITMVDFIGREVLVIAEGSYSSLSETVDVKKLSKGMYKIKYEIEGAVVKAESVVID